MKIEKEKKPQYRSHFENSDELCEYMADITGGVTM